DGSALGNFVRYLAVRPLELLQEIESRARGRKISLGRDGERRPERVAPEEPGKAGTLAVAGSAKTRYQSGAKIRVGRNPFIDPDFRPGERGVQAFVRCADVDGLLLESLIVPHVVLVEFLRVEQQFVVSRDGLLAPAHAPRHDNRNEFRSGRFGGSFDDEFSR